MKDKASDHNISYSTVARCLKTFALSSQGPTIKSYLPSTLLFDEFKSVKNISGKMSFMFVNGEDNSIIDIVEIRQLDYLIKYFHYYKKEARDKVKYIVIDMYQPYIQLIKKMFVNATIVFDKFHIVQHLTRSLNKARIDLMKKDKKNYSKLKRYQKLLLKDRNDLNPIEYKYSNCFKKNMSATSIAEYLINLDNEFNKTYEYYQDFISAIKFKDVEKLDALLSDIPEGISKLARPLQSLIKNKEYVLNSILCSYTNGPIEGINNKIKLLKQAAYGYNSFHNFKTRIMLHFNFLKHIKR